MFNSADFDALQAQIERRCASQPEKASIAIERFRLLNAIDAVRLLAKEYGLMVPEPPASPICQECGAAPAKSYSRLCEACYAIAVDEIRAELAQEAPTVCGKCGTSPADFYPRLCGACYNGLVSEIEQGHTEGQLYTPAIVDASDDALEAIL
jgi:hypothetical protein